MPKRTRPISDGAIRRRVSLVRHSHLCKICAHKKRKEMEAEFVARESLATIAKNFHLADRASVYRHARAFGLFEKRRRNVRAALERIIEHVGGGRDSGAGLPENQRAGAVDRPERASQPKRIVRAHDAGRTRSVRSRWPATGKPHFCPQQIRPPDQEISQWVRRHRGPPPRCF
jgi:hypothetical protein